MSAHAGFATAEPLRFQAGARTLLAVPRRLVRVAWSLDEVLARRLRARPPLGDADGWLLTSVPEALLDDVGAEGFVAHVRQRYVRRHVDLTIGYAAWASGLSAGMRQDLRRKARRIGGADVRAYRTPAEVAAFLALARPLSARTYQDRLLGEGLPDTPAFAAIAGALAAQDAVRAWLLFHEGAPIAYLWCIAEGEALRYDLVGHDPAHAHRSPGTILLAEAIARLFGDRFARFDFTEGDGEHKRRFATGGTRCTDLLLLRPTPANRAAIAAIAGFDAAVAFAKRVAGARLAGTIARWLRRG